MEIMNTYFIRFTDTINEDIKRGTSVITVNSEGVETSPVVVEGLCVFGGYSTIGKAQQKANFLQKIIGFEVGSYSILTGLKDSEITGSLGTVIKNIQLVANYKI